MKYVGHLIKLLKWIKNEMRSTLLKSTMIPKKINFHLLMLTEFNVLKTVDYSIIK